MTAADLARIEAALRITLPRSYRELVAASPIPAHAGNCDTDLWDDADALIDRNRELRDRNRELRDREREPWPAELFFIGDPVSGSANALDLRSPTAAVWWVDHCELAAPSSGAIAPSFDAWAHAYVAATRADLERDGIDPDVAPDPA